MTAFMTILRLTLLLLAGLALFAAARAILPELGARVVFEAEGDFGRVRVTERRDGMRVLYMGEGRARQSAVYPGRPLELVPAYLEVGMVGPALAPMGGRILFVGLGGGAMPMFTRRVRPDAFLEAVELDPLIVDVAGRFFGFLPDERLVVHVGDGRAFIERSAPGTYDVIVLDAFSDDEIPFALTTYEFLAATRDALAPRGVVVSNLWTANRSHPAMVATYQEVFPSVHLVGVTRRPQTILVAGLGDRALDRAALVNASRTLAGVTDLGFDLARLVERGYEQPRTPSAAVLRDADVAQPQR